MRNLAALILACLPIFAQTLPSDHYIATASTTALTIQQPAANGRQITFPPPGVAGAWVYCAAAQTATLSWNGTAATTTAGAEVKLPGTFAASGMTVWTASNVGAGITGPVYNIAAGGTVPLDLSWFRFGTQGSGANLTISTSGTCTINFLYSAT
jgi:hypothetical protein